MRAQAALLALLMLSAGVAGCSGGGSKNDSPAGDGDQTDTHGTVLGLITDDEARPLEEVSVALKTVKVSPIKIKIFTNSEGRFRLENVPAGRQTVIAEKNGYQESSTTMTVLPGTDNTVRLVLEPAPIYEYRIVPLNVMQGRYDCALEAVVTSGSCDYEVYNQTGQKVLEADNNDTLMIPSGWSGLLFQVKWETGTVEPTMEGIRFQLESQEDMGGMFIKSSAATSPMRIQINAGQVLPEATLGYSIPQRGVGTWVHVLPLGHQEGATCAAQCGYGAGVALDLHYEVYVTIFYGGPVDETYSALPE